MSKRKEQRRCQDCNAPVISSKKRCWDCEAKKRRQHERRRDARREAAKREASG